MTASDPHAHTHLPDLTATAWAIGLPRDLVPICEDNQGGYYFITQQGSIGLWTPDAEVTEQQWETLWEWISDIWINS